MLGEHMFAPTPTRPPLPPDVAALVRPVSLAKARTLPLDEPWRGLMPDGALRRGATVAITAEPGLGGLSVALSLLSGATAQGHWAAVVGVDDPGVVAMVDLGIDLRRVLFVARPRGAWAESTADLLDGVDLVVVRPPARPAHGAARRLVDRVRERGAVLITLNEPRGTWPLPAEVQLQVSGALWERDTRLRSRHLTVRVGGRGDARRHGEYAVMLPDPEGRAVAS
jgi:hypothetical protein